MTSLRESGRRAVVAGVLFVLAAAGPWTLPAAAAAPAPTRYVATNGSDTENDCLDSAHPCATIQHAVDQADPGDTISIAGGPYHESVRIRISLTLVGAGATGSGRTTVDGDTQDGDPSIWIDGVDTNTPPDVTVRGLDVSGNQDNDGILVVDATATITDSVVSNNNSRGLEAQDNSTVHASGTSFNGNGDSGVLLASGRLQAALAAPAAQPSATLTDDVISDNDRDGVSVDIGSASIDHSTVSGNKGGGVIVAEGTADVTASTLDANAGAGVVATGSGSQVTLTTSTVSNTVPFSHNEGESFGGGVLVFSGGVTTVDNSTIFGNTGQGVLSENGTTTVENSTISGTLAKPGDSSLPVGGVAVASVTAAVRRAVTRYPVHVASARTQANADVSPKTTVTGTISADNTTVDDCKGSIVDRGYNLAGDDSCTFDATGSLNSATARLGGLANNGGPTKTLLPAKGSDAIDAIPSGSAGCVADAADQRGVSRPQGPKCDIGAVEADQPTVVISPDSLPHGTVATTYHVKLTATGGLGAPYEFSLASGTSLPPGLELATDGTISGTPTEAGTFPFTVSVDDPTLKDYTIVIDALAASPSSTTQPIANTGARVAGITTFGTVTIALGVLLLLGAAYSGRRNRRAH